jgi:hypothetical protein
MRGIVLAFDGGSALGLVSAQDHLLVCQLLLGRGVDLLAAATYDWKNALEVYGSCASPLITPAIKEERREALRVVFAEGPHESQVQRRRNDR